MATETTSVQALSAEDLLQHWQGHRRLTRRIIEAFPEDKLFTYSSGGMRTFGELANEMLGMAVPTVIGVATGKWDTFKEAKPATKSEVLKMWDEQTPLLDEKFPTIPQHRFSEVDKAFGQWEMPGVHMLLYIIDNEVHHRGQGYVYLRELGIAPAPFWER